MARDGKQDNIIEKDRKQAKNKPKEKIKGMKKNMTPEKDLKKIKSGSIVKLFDKTPAPKKQNDVYCPHFWELKYANGCKFDCPIVSGAIYSGHSADGGRKATREHRD